MYMHVSPTMHRRSSSIMMNVMMAPIKNRLYFFLLHFLLLKLRIRLVERVENLVRDVALLDIPTV